MAVEKVLTVLIYSYFRAKNSNAKMRNGRRKRNETRMSKLTKNGKMRICGFFVETVTIK